MLPRRLPPTLQLCKQKCTLRILRLFRCINKRLAHPITPCQLSMSPTNTSICKHAHPAILHKTVPAIRTGFLFFLMASYALLGPRDTKCSGILGAVQINIQQTDLQIASTKLAGIFKAGERNLLRTWSSHEIGACCPLDCPTHLICLQKRVGNLHLHLESQHVTPTSNRSIHTSRHSKGSHKTQHSHTVPQNSQNAQRALRANSRITTGAQSQMRFKYLGRHLVWLQ